MSCEPLQLDLHCAALANRAMGSVLLLYYHLLREGGITSDQTVYVDAADFDPFAYLAVEVPASLSDVDQVLLRQGAAIHLLCDLNDMVGEYESDYLKQPLVKKILVALASDEIPDLPEATTIARTVSAGEHLLKFDELADSLSRVYQRYVVGRFRALTLA